MHEHPLPRGALVGRYRVRELLREDPDARTYAATDEDSSRLVTLRLFAADSSTDFAQFAGHTEALEGVSHEHVATVYETGSYWGELFLAREHIRGKDLRSLIEDGERLPLSPAIAIAEQIASGLSELRRGGLLGAYLTPRNVLVDSPTTSPHAYVVDLGLIPTRPESGILPPEAGRGVSDERSDVFALGALLRGELTGVLAGEPTDAPFRTQTPSRQPAGLPDALERVLARAIREDPADRYATPATLLRAVHRAADPGVDTPIRLTFSRAPSVLPAPAKPRGRARPDGGGGGGIGRAPGQAAGGVPRDGAGASPGTLPGRGGGGDSGPPEDSRSTATEGDPPRSAFALLAAPESVLVGEGFELKIGLSATPDPRLAGDERMERPADSRGPYTLAIHVLAPSFRLRPGESWRNELRVTQEDPYPRLVLHLTAKPVESSWESCLIQATYSTEGQTMGLAVRPIGVARSADLIDQAKPEEQPRTSAVPTTDGWPKPDLTINILATKPGDPDSLTWTFVSRHALKLPRAQPSPLGAEPQHFAKQVIEGVAARDGALDAYQFACGVGRNVARKAPKSFWKLLDAVAKEAKSPPTVLINSVDPYVPWELAVLPQPLDPTLPPFLGAQATVGRWVVDTVSPPPTPPLPREPSLSMTVISGVYDRPGLTRLKAAEEEAKRLADDHRAIPVDASLAPVLACLEAQPISDLLHFAMHARMQLGGFRNGLVLENEQVLHPITVEGLEFASAPFVFLNACQAGAGDELLGDYAGLAAAFLRAGASAVVAPLWAVDDTVARDIALRFYDDVFATGADIAGYFRDERARFSKEAQPVSTTHLAYIFYGHPTMRLHAMKQLAADG
jgi:hypothetical protein